MSSSDTDLDVIAPGGSVDGGKVASANISPSNRPAAGSTK